jgi:16S rRNA (cytosine967-C5)-methyltransferase
VQDAAAALPARLLNVVAGERVLDLCAAPGGKTLQLAARGAQVTAVERSPKRAALLRANLARCRATATVVEADGAAYAPAAPFPKTLLDAPCSATGTIRRHPDIARRRAAIDFAGLAAAQDRLLDAAVRLTAPGGTLVYAVCSLEPIEGPERIEALLARNASVTRDPIRPDEIAGIAEAISPHGDLRTLPSQIPDLGGWDGFYACRLRRR